MSAIDKLLKKLPEGAMNMSAEELIKSIIIQHLDDKIFPRIETEAKRFIKEEIKEQLEAQKNVH